MPNHRSPAANGNSVPTYLPISQAARKYNISENVLTRMIQDGRIDAAQLPSGELLVSDDNLDQTKTKEQVIKEKFAHLRRKPITISKAAESYALAGTTIREWINRGYITIIDSGYPTKIDEAEVAYCAEVYKERTSSGFSTRIFDENGLPYELKHPDLSEYRRRRKRKKIAPQM
jgi:hypothetical protein